MVWRRPPKNTQDSHLFNLMTIVSDFLLMLQRSDADAATVDGGQVYTAGKCGLVPAMVEQYDAGDHYRD